MNLTQNRYVASRKPVKHGGLFSISKPRSDILDFSSNINPLGFPPLVRKHLKTKLNSISEYPDTETTMLKKSLKWYTRLPENQIIVGNGATELIYNFCQSFLNNKTRVLIQAPTFGEYEAAARLSGCNISFYKTMSFSKDFEKFISKIPKNGCVFLCNPNNPTGELLSKNIIFKIIEAAKEKKSLVFLDESFIELVPNSNQSIIKSIKKFENLFILRSMTKSFGLAGLRIGYGIGSKQIINVLNKIKIPWNVSGLAQDAARAALCHTTYLEKAKKLIKKESSYLRNSISQIEGFQCHESSTNFILIKTKMKSKELQKKLLKKKILIRDASTFHGLNQHYIRIAVKTHKENQKLVKALEEA